MPIEYASGPTSAFALEGYRSLARHTGLAAAEIATMAARGELRSLFGSDGNLLSQIEIRSRFGSTAQALASLERHRGGIRGCDALAEMMRRRPTTDARAELVRMKAIRRAWTNP